MEEEYLEHPDFYDKYQKPYSDAFYAMNKAAFEVVNAGPVNRAEAKKKFKELQKEYNRLLDVFAQAHDRNNLALEKKQKAERGVL